MDFELTAEQELARRTAREFAEAEIAPVIARYDEAEEFPAELMAKLGALGFRHRLAHDLAQRIAERSLHGKGDYRDGQHDQNGFRRPLPDEGQRCAKRL